MTRWPLCLCALVNESRGRCYPGLALYCIMHTWTAAWLFAAQRDSNVVMWWNDDIMVVIIYMHRPSEGPADERWTNFVLPVQKFARCFEVGGNSSKQLWRATLPFDQLVCVWVCMVPLLFVQFIVSNSPGTSAFVQYFPSSLYSFEYRTEPGKKAKTHMCDAQNYIWRSVGLELVNRWNLCRVFICGCFDPI